MDKTKEEILEQLRKEHPLVKDDRCFRLNWWPVTRPACFDDEDYED